ncbi:glycosyltransferase family 4 protein [Coleofasciculus sp. E2-BRE-01]|uniref:glycosyltransferase family 4 protein n=1 Tax=Coleofasciculus sp. E2-BRE-01 TaxID=3069524 RepID=UPI0032F9E1E3
MNNLKVAFLSRLGNNLHTDLFVKHLQNREIKVNLEESNFHFIFLPKIFGQEKPDIIHLHTLHYFFLGKNFIHRWIKFLIFTNQILILKSMGIKIVWTVHEWTDRFSGGKQDILPKWSILLGKLFDAIITHCDTTKNQIIEAFHLEKNHKVFVVHLGNYIGTYKNEINKVNARKILGISTEATVWLLFGNIHRTKGFVKAIDAFKQLPGKDIFLIVAGYPAEPDIENIIRDKIKNYPNILFFPKRVPNDEIQLYMNASDCMISPYQVFTTSGATLLAMSFGKACIAPNQGFFRDILDDAGSFLYDATTEDGLFSAIKQANEKREHLSTMGQHNFQLAKQWSWDYVADETLKIYHRCLE